MTARAEAVEQTREDIMQAAYRLWLGHPYDEVTVEAIAEEAGVSRQTVHRHFGTKDELMVAVTEWRGPQEEAARQVAVGDVAAAVERVVDRNEEMGDANVRALELEGRVEAIDHMLAAGRRSHARWVQQVFEPHLPTESSPARQRVVDGLFAATDVTVWKLLRRDLGRSRSETVATIRRLVEGVLSGAGAPTEGDVQ